MATNHEKYDSSLLGILQNEGKVAPFLDVILGFLYRRTDYFRIMKTENDRLGFPPGVAYNLLENIFKKYETLAAENEREAEELRKSREQNIAEDDNAREKPKVAKTKEQIAQATKGSSNSLNSDSLDGQSLKESVEQKKEKEANMDVDNLNESDHSAKQKDSDNEKDDEDKEDPEQARQRRNLQANPLTYNGAERDHYYWSQTISETDVRVKVPKTIVKGKQVKVILQKKHISVSNQNEHGSWSDIVNGDLSWEINTDESMWTLVPGEFVHINLEKKQERWWENVFVKEPKINTQKIDCSRPMTDLDDEAQAKIEEMMYNQRQKQLGLPQSHEAKTHEMLRKAWDAEGSPFKGQPFDPNRYSVDPSGIVNFTDK